MNTEGNEMVLGMFEVGGKLVLEGWHGGEVTWESIWLSKYVKGIQTKDGERMVSCDICAQLLFSHCSTVNCLAPPPLCCFSSMNVSYEPSNLLPCSTCV
jgi:hypothetical protein